VARFGRAASRVCCRDWGLRMVVFARNHVILSQKAGIVPNDLGIPLKYSVVDQTTEVVRERERVVW
jgi:activator of 2-hydroxyglutaryl-CoA dehydratase